MDNTRFALSAYVCWRYITVHYWIETSIFIVLKQIKYILGETFSASYDT